MTTNKTDEKILKTLLVRRQDQSHGMWVDSNGDLNLHRGDSGKINTTHFMCNGLVMDHAYGSFEHNRMAIIADPSEVKLLPSGFKQVDVWFQSDKNGDLNIGKAVIIAPYGMDLPENANVIRYHDTENNSLSIELDKYLASKDIESQTPDSDQWSSYQSTGCHIQSIYNDSQSWERGAADQIWGERAKEIPTYSGLVKLHEGSHDDRIGEFSRQAIHYTSLAEKNAPSIDKTFSDRIDMAIMYVDALKKEIALFKEEMPPEIVAQASGYIDKIESRRAECIDRITAMREIDKNPCIIESTDAIGRKTQTQNLTWDDAASFVCSGMFDLNAKVLDRTPVDGVFNRNVGSISAVFVDELRLANRSAMSSPPPVPAPPVPASVVEDANKDDSHSFTLLAKKAISAFAGKSLESPAAKLRLMRGQSSGMRMQ